MCSAIHTFCYAIVLSCLVYSFAATSNDEKEDRVSLRKFLEDKWFDGIKGTRGKFVNYVKVVDCPTACYSVPTSSLDGLPRTPFFTPPPAVISNGRAQEQFKWIVLDLGRHQAVEMVNLALDTSDSSFKYRGQDLDIRNAFTVQLLNDIKYSDTPTFSSEDQPISVPTGEGRCQHTDSETGSTAVYTARSDDFRLGTGSEELRMKVVSYIYYNASMQTTITGHFYNHHLARAIKIHPLRNIGIYAILVSTTLVDIDYQNTWTTDAVVKPSEGINIANRKPYTAPIGDIIEQQSKDVSAYGSIEFTAGAKVTKCIGQLFDGISSSKGNYNARERLSVTFSDTPLSANYSLVASEGGDVCGVQLWFSQRQLDEMSQPSPYAGVERRALLRLSSGNHSTTLFMSEKSLRQPRLYLPVSLKLAESRRIDFRFELSKGTTLFVEEMALVSTCVDLLGVTRATNDIIAKFKRLYCMSRDISFDVHDGDTGEMTNADDPSNEFDHLVAVLQKLPDTQLNVLRNRLNSDGLPLDSNRTGNQSTVNVSTGLIGRSTVRRTTPSPVLVLTVSVASWLIAAVPLLIK